MGQAKLIELGLLKGSPLKMDLIFRDSSFKCFSDVVLIYWSVSIDEQIAIENHWVRLETKILFVHLCK